MSITQHEEYVIIGDRLRAERERLGQTQKELASKLKTSERTIISYEYGQTAPKLDKLILLCSLGADINFILTGTRSAVDLVTAVTPAQRLAVCLAELPLGEPDCEIVLNIAKRLASGST